MMFYIEIITLFENFVFKIEFRTRKYFICFVRKAATYSIVYINKMHIPKVHDSYVAPLSTKLNKIANQ